MLGNQCLYFLKFMVVNIKKNKTKQPREEINLICLSPGDNRTGRKFIYSHVRNSSETDALQKNYSKRLEVNALLPKLENEVINGLSKSVVV